jgi:hypothetical protein
MEGSMADQHRKTIPAVSEGRSIASPKVSDPAGRMKLGSYHAKLILGSYRADQANDPEIYVTAIAHLLSRYDPDIGARLTDPKDGVAGKYKFLPTVSEVKEEADRLEEADRRYVRQQRNLRDQFHLRDEMDAADKVEPPEYRQQVIARIKAELRDSGFRFKGDPKPQQTWQQFSADELLAKYSPKEA